MTAVLEKPVAHEYFEPKPGDIWWQPIDEILAYWYSCDGGCPGDWQELLDDKREDIGYGHIVASLKKRGFVVPLTCRWSENAKRAYPHFLDGHHRLAAAIDLGRSHVKMQMHESYFYYKNSGDWIEGCRITRKPRGSW